MATAEEAFLRRKILNYKYRIDEISLYIIVDENTLI